MEFIIDQNILVEALQKIQGPSSFKQNFPILNAILIETNNENIKFTTTDLDITIRSSIKGKVETQGKIAIPAKHFIPIIRELPHGDVNIAVVKNNMLIKCGKIEFKINCIDPSEFPLIEEGKKKTLIKIDPGELEKMLKLTSFCAGVEDTNYVLNGIFFQLYEDTISLTATDGKRLAHIKRNLPSSQSEIHSKIEFIFPLKSVHEFLKLIKDFNGDLFLFINKNTIGFDFKDTLFLSKPIEGEFPPYECFIPQPIENKLIINRKDFLSALKRAELLTAPDYQWVKLELKKEEINIFKSTPQLGEIKEGLDVQYTGPHITVGFNPIYLIDVLKNIEEETIAFEIYDIDKPAVLRLNTYIYLILPMKL